VPVSQAHKEVLVSQAQLDKQEALVSLAHKEVQDKLAHKEVDSQDLLDKPVVPVSQAHKEVPVSQAHKEVLVSQAQLDKQEALASQAHKEVQDNLAHKEVDSQDQLEAQVSPAQVLLPHSLVHLLLGLPVLNDLDSLEATRRENICPHDRRQIVQTKNVKNKTTQRLVLTLFIYFAFILLLIRFYLDFIIHSIMTKFVYTSLLISFNAMEVVKRKFPLESIKLDPKGSVLTVNCCKRNYVISFISI